MADSNRETPSDLRAQLCDEARRYSFFQLIYLLERYGANLMEQSAFAEVGYRHAQESELLRFRPEASLAFSAADVAALEYCPQIASAQKTQHEHLLLTATCLGLYGTVSPLPTNYTEAIIFTDLDEHQRREFLDLFHHRIYSLFYRCWKKYRYYLEYRSGAVDLFSDRVFALIGLSAGVRGHCVIDQPVLVAEELAAGEPVDVRQEYAHLNWVRLLSYTGVLNMRVRPAAVMEKVVSHYFRGVPTEIRQCVERWVSIEEDQKNRIGLAGCALGEEFVLGERVLDRAGKFELILGPISFERFCSFLPGSKNYSILTALVKYLLVDQLDFSIRLVLKRSEVPIWGLTADSSVRLGWSGWCGDPGTDDPSVLLPGRGNYAEKSVLG